MMNDQIVTVASNVNFNAVLSICGIEFLARVAPMRYEFHVLRLFLSCKLKSTVLRMNLRFAAQLTFQCEAP